MAKWQRFKAQEEALSMRHLYKIVSMGSTIVDFYPENEKPVRNLSTKLSLKVHERLDVIAKSIPGMTKEKLVRFIIDAGIFEYCKEMMDSTLFPPDTDDMNTAESLVDEAIQQIKSEVR